MSIRPPKEGNEARTVGASHPSAYPPEGEREPEEEGPSDFPEAHPAMGSSYEMRRGSEPKRPISRQHAQLEKALLVLVSIALGGSALSLGAVHTVVLVPIALVAIAAALVAVPLRETTAPNRGLPAPMMLLLGLSLFTAFQAVPFPLRFLSIVAPANADVWARSLLPFGEHPTWGSISLDPGATVVEALKWLTYACTFFGASVLAARQGARVVLALVFASSTLIALVTLAHGMADAQKIFGLYKPNYPFPSNHIGPLPNPNNLAGYLNLGTMCGVGLIVMRRPIFPPWLVAVGVAFDIGATVRAASRGGVAALIFGILVLAVIAGGRAIKSSSLRRRTAPFVLAGGTIALGAGLALLGGDVWVWRELLNDNLFKLKISTWCIPLIQAHPWFGVGRGAFESVFPAYRPTVGLNIVFTHPENFLAQWVSEWGVPVAALALLAFAWMFRPTALGVRRSAVAAAGWVAIVALLVQNLADLGMEIPATGIAAAVILGGLWGDPSHRSHRERTAFDRTFLKIGNWRFASVMAVAGVLLSVLALSLTFRELSAQRERLRDHFERAEDEVSERAPFRFALHDAMRLRPAEHYFPLLGAMAAFRWKDQSPMPWIQQTLERAPVNGRAHALLASVLAARGARKQALLEVRLAVSHEPGLADTVAPLATSLAKTFEELLIAVPEGTAGAPMLMIMARSIEDAALQRRVDSAALLRDPKLIESRERLLSSLFRALDAHAQGSAPSLACLSLETLVADGADGALKAQAVKAPMDQCLDEVEKHAAAIDTTRPDSSLGGVMRARGLIAAGKRPDAEALLAIACSRLEGRAECLQARAQNLAALDGGEKLDVVLKEYVSAACTSAATCAAASTFVGDIREGRGDLFAAATAFNKAAQEDPTEERWLRAASAAEKAKMYALAIEALQRVASLRGGADTELAGRLSRLRKAAAQQMIRF